MEQINIIQGDKFTMDLSFASRDGNSLNLEGLSFLFCGKYDPMDNDNIAFKGSVEVVNKNTLRCTIPSNITKKLKVAMRYNDRLNLYWDIYCVEKELTILSGLAKVQAGISFRGNQ